MRHAPLRTFRHPASRLGVNPRRDDEGDAPLRVPNEEAGRDASLRAPNVPAGGGAPLRAPDAGAGGIHSHAVAAALLALLGCVAAVSAAAPPEPAERPPAVVRLADGSSVPLRQGSLSYEYFSWPPGGAQTDGTPPPREGSA